MDLVFVREVVLTRACALRLHMKNEYRKQSCRLAATSRYDV